MYTPNDDSQEVYEDSFVLMLIECPEGMVNIQFDQICGRERSPISDTSL